MNTTPPSPSSPPPADPNQAVQAPPAPAPAASGGAKLRGSIALALTIWGLGAMAYAAMWLNAGDIDDLREQGVAATATVRDRSRHRNPSNDTTSHSFEITYMHKATAAPRPTVHVDVMSGELELPPIDVGSFVRVRIDVPGSAYRNYDVGDDVAILYLPGDPGSARLTEQVEGWSTTPGRILVSLFMLGGLACLGYGLKAWSESI